MTEGDGTFTFDHRGGFRESGSDENLIALCDYLKDHGRCGVCGGELTLTDSLMGIAPAITLVLLPFEAEWNRPTLRIVLRDGSLGPFQAMGAVCGGCVRELPQTEVHWEINEAVDVVRSAEGAPIDHRYHPVEELPPIYLGMV